MYDYFSAGEVDVGLDYSHQKIGSGWVATVQAGGKSRYVQAPSQSKTLHSPTPQKGFAARNGQCSIEGCGIEVTELEGIFMEIPVAIHKDENSVYGVVVPDVPGCFSWGESIEGALINAREAIYSHIDAMIDEGIPVEIGQSKMGDLVTNAEYAGATWALVDIDLDRHLIHKPHARA